MPDVVDLQDTQDARLLEALYRDLYLPNFPIVAGGLYVYWRSRT